MDVNVVDNTGRPVENLTAADFALSVDGKPRRIASAQFISVARNVGRSGACRDPLQLECAGGRRAADHDRHRSGQHRRGGGKLAIDAASAVRRAACSKSDRVGLSTIPGAGPQMDFTPTMHWCRRCCKRVVGQRDATLGPKRIGISEALEINRGDVQVIAEVIDRECAGMRTPEGDRSLPAADRTKRATYSDTRMRRQASLVALRYLIERLAQSSVPEDAGAPLRRPVHRSGVFGALLARPDGRARAGRRSTSSSFDPPQFEAATSARVSPTRERGHRDRAGRARPHRQHGAGIGVPRREQRRFRVQPARARALGVLPSELRAAAGRSRRQAAQDQNRRARTEGDRGAIATGVRGRPREVQNGRGAARRNAAVPFARRRHRPEGGRRIRSRIRSRRSCASLSRPRSTDRSTPQGTVALAYVLIDSRGVAVASQIEPRRRRRRLRAAGKTQTYFEAIAADPPASTR